MLELFRQELVEDVGGRFGAFAEVAYSQGLIEANASDTFQRGR